MKKHVFLFALIAAILMVPMIPQTRALETTSQTITSTGTIAYRRESSAGLTYLSLYHLYSTPDSTLDRDFTKFQKDGIKTISLALYWYRLEGNQRGNYNETNSGDNFLDNIKHVIAVANQHSISVFINFNTLWGNDSIWCTPKYVVDPITNQNDGLAIVRSPEMQQAFVDMFNHTVRYLAGTPGIAAWAILNEPWYWGRTADEHDFITANGKTQKENFIDIMQQLSAIVKQYDGRPVTVKFPSAAKWTGIDGLEHLKDIFVNDWNWDQRIFNALDFISFDNYIPANSDLESTWRNITSTDVIGCYNRNKVVWISELGFDGSDSNMQATNFGKSIQLYESLPIAFISAWCWEGDNNNEGTFGYGGTGMNLCANGEGGIAMEAYQQLISFMPSKP